MNFNDKQAIYLQIADYVCDKILTSEWRPEDKIPSVRDLAIELQVNPNTVMRAYEYLQQLEVIYNKRGIGHHVAPDAKGVISGFRKQLFFENELPQLFKNLELLNISFGEIQIRFDNYLKSSEKQQNENKQ
jgi:GntR family transcriptional regulator